MGTTTLGFNVSTSSFNAPSEAWPPVCISLISICFFQAKRIVCQRYAEDVCNSLGRPYSLEQLNHLAALFEEYINTYIEKAGGYSKLIFYSCEEVEAIEDESIKELLEVIEWYKKRFLLL